MLAEGQLGRKGVRFSRPARASKLRAGVKAQDEFSRLALYILVGNPLSDSDYRLSLVILLSSVGAARAYISRDWALPKTPFPTMLCLAIAVRPIWAHVVIMVSRVGSGTRGDSEIPDVDNTPP